MSLCNIVLLGFAYIFLEIDLLETKRLIEYSIARSQIFLYRLLNFSNKFQYLDSSKYLCVQSPEFLSVLTLFVTSVRNIVCLVTGHSRDGNNTSYSTFKLILSVSACRISFRGLRWCWTTHPRDAYRGRVKSAKNLYILLIYIPWL